MSTETCTICGSDKGKEVSDSAKRSRDVLCYVCSCWFLTECQRRTGFGNTIVVMVEPENEEAYPVIGRKKNMEPVN